MISYAQNAEDVVLARVFEGRTGGVYVDIGAGDPTDCSVTRHFYDLGWSGLNVEPDPVLHPRLCRERPRDVNLAVAISDHEGTATLLVAPPDLPGTSSLHGELLSPLPANDGFRPYDVAVITLATLLDRYPFPAIDFLKIDVEGHEDAVVRGGDWERHQPRVLVVEATVPHTPVPAGLQWETVLTDAGYRCALFDGLNRFYARAEDTEALTALSAPANIFDGYEVYRSRATIEALAEEVRAVRGELAAATEYAHDLGRHLEEHRRQGMEASRAAEERLNDLRRRVCDLAREARRIAGFDGAG